MSWSVVWLVLLVSVVKCQLLPGGIDQSSDWLIHPTCTPSTAVFNNDTSLLLSSNSLKSSHYSHPVSSSDSNPLVLTLSNSLISRSFLLQPALCTVDFVRRGLGSDLTLIRALAPEGNITFNHSYQYDIGGCAGIPNGHAEYFDLADWIDKITAPSTSFTYSSLSMSAPVAPFPFTPGHRGSPSNLQWPPAGLHLTLHLNPPTDGTFQQLFGMDDVQLDLHYEIYDCLPVLRKWVTITVPSSPSPAASSPILVSSLTLELLRSPNGSPEHLSFLVDNANNPTPNDDQVPPQLDQAFPGRLTRLWFFDPDDDANNDQELHVPYTYYTYFMYGYDAVDVVYGGTKGPGALLSRNDPSLSTSFTSISLREVVHDSVDFERQGLTIRRVQAALAPQLLENPMHMMITDISSDAAFRQAIDQAAEVGLEMLVVGFGANGYCGLCDGQMLNSTWVSWFSSQLAYARSKKVEISAYTLMQHNGWGEDVPVSEQALSRDGNRQGQACFATDWHATYRQNVLNFIKQVGLGGLETDGQYEGLSCSDSTGDHRHAGVEGSWHAQLMSTLQFNSALKELQVFQTGADAYMFSGANRWNHADTDAGYNRPFWDALQIGRVYCFDSTHSRLPSSGMYGLNDIVSTATQTCGSNGRIRCIDFALGSFLGSGTWAYLRSGSVYALNDPLRTAMVSLFQGWTSFWNAYRRILIADALHLVRPTARSIEATLMSLPLSQTFDSSSSSSSSSSANQPFAILCLVNPRANHTLSTTLPVSLYYSGVTVGSVVQLQQLFYPPPSPSSDVSFGAAATPYGTGTGVTLHKVGADGFGTFEIAVSAKLTPRSYAIFVISTTS